MPMQQCTSCSVYIHKLPCRNRADLVHPYPVPHFIGALLLVYGQSVLSIHGLTWSPSCAWGLRYTAA